MITPVGDAAAVNFPEGKSTLYARRDRTVDTSLAKRGHLDVCLYTDPTCTNLIKWFLWSEHKKPKTRNHWIIVGDRRWNLVWVE